MPRDLPLNEIPGLRTVTTPLAVNAAAAMWIDNILVYSTGIAFTVNAEFRQEFEPGTVNLGTYASPILPPACSWQRCIPTAEKRPTQPISVPNQLTPTNRSSCPPTVQAAPTPARSRRCRNSQTAF